MKHTLIHTSLPAVGKGMRVLLFTGGGGSRKRQSLEVDEADAEPEACSLGGGFILASGLPP